MKFYKTIYTFEVLSEGPLESMSLKELHRATLNGDCVGRFGDTDEAVLTGLEMASALQEFGSEPGFFELTEDGRRVPEE